MANHSRSSDPKKPDDLPAEPDSPSWSRRGFVRTASGLFVASFPALNACTIIDLVAIPSGTVRVTVTGFDPNATAAGTLSGTVDGQALAITLSPPSAGSSSGEATNVAGGTYNVTYTPPDDHRLSSADLGSETKSVTVTAASGGNLSWDVDPRTGMVLVTITGFPDTATEAGTISGDVPITLSTPTAGTSSGQSGQVLIGPHDVTYTPPVGHRLVNADIGLATKRAAVSENASSNLAWGVEPAPPAPPVLFHSDWSTATGTSDAAILDTDKTVPWENVRGSIGNEVVSASGLDFPTTNVYQASAIWRPANPGASQTGPDIDSSLSGAVPDIGNSIFYRVYLRITTPDAYDGDQTSHPYGDGPGGGNNTNWQLQILTNTDGTWRLRMQVRATAFPNTQWAGPILNKNQTYRLEHRIHRIGTLTANLHIRVYDSSDVLIATNVDFDNLNSTANLASTPTLDLNNINFFTGIKVGLNGLNSGVESDFPFVSTIYGAMAMRTDDWCGPYANGI